MSVIDCRGLMDFVKQRNLYLHAGFVVLALIVAYDFTFIRFSLSQQYIRSTLTDLVSGKATTPFQYRVLIPWLVKALYETLAHFRFTASTGQLFWFMEFIAAFFLLAAYQAYLSLFFKDQLTRAILPFTIVLILPFNFLLSRTGVYYYPWDTPSLLFFTLGLVFLYKKNWTLYYPLFVIGLFNRETIAFLTFIYLFAALGKNRLKTTAFHCSLQLLIWISIKLFLYRLYIHNPGTGFFQHHFSSNLSYLTNPANYPILFSCMGFIWIPAILGYRLVKDDFARRSILVFIPFSLTLLFAAKIGELRHWAELIPVILTAFLLVIKELVKRE